MERSSPIPFNRASFVGEEWDYLETVRSSGEMAGNQALTKKVESLLEKALPGGTALLTTSCTSALEVIAMGLNLSSDDHFIVPSFTFVSSAAAFSRTGARPLFSDIRPDTLNIDERFLETLITPQTKAIVLTHYGGVGAEMEEIQRVATKYGIAVVEDNAHGLFGTYCEKPLGAIGTFAALSFHTTKNFTSGQGGAIIAREGADVEQLRNIRENGTNRAAFERNEVDHYTWVTQGTNALASELLAGVLLAQLENRERIQHRREQIWRRYETALAGWAKTNGVTLPYIPPHCVSSYHLFHLIMPTRESRNRFIAHMKNHTVTAPSHYVPLHDSPMGQRFGGRRGQCPVSEEYAARLVRLPLFFSLTDAQQDAVVDAVVSFHQFA